MNTKNSLREDSICFAIKISDLCEEMQGCSVYRNQLIRSSSSIGANIHEAKYAQSRADFINKLEIALKETYRQSIYAYAFDMCNSTRYALWLDIFC